ncbi:aldehyde dehydrogenase (NADP(+)) [Amycolatopsis pithecellobii]|uniref:Aldehyde dehydrogenase family protein n=1 Tax=Amycolatopsis pithecellobii TaxID=664692 RepID=A0A6N7YZX5_9PSEU|nr:aldehyde dehydrogenase (NADP(+)) [Amycolatopsis pithecellobii]MTD57538.1 aldehyde dehydrogenase family protein [Amycolatopsis pithecellobii]
MDTTELEPVLAAAAQAAPRAAEAAPGERAAWLAAVADALDAAAGELLPLAAAETQLPAEPRLAGELARTTFQLRLFGEVLRDGAFLGATVDHADPGWPMGPRPDIRRTVVPIGPVLVFAASNFPFAFSVAGGDTASALAAGCPVVLKAHPGHPRLSARTGEIVRDALTGAGAPPGIFDVIFGVETGVTALKDPRISAASFTGSVAGGRALFDIAVSRPVPIPFYGELGSVNPVIVTPGAVRARGARIAEGYVGSFTLGAGQFCTKPGLLFLPEGHGLETPLAEAARAVGARPMLNDRIAEGFQAGVARLREQPAVTVLASGGPFEPTLLSVRAADFLKADEVLRSECFGPASIVVTYAGQDELLEVLAGLEPGLTAAVHAEDSETEDVRELLPSLTRLAGRLLWNDWPTGVTVTWAQQHGGPYPATTTPTTTSVGTAAIERFLRPVAWQGFPDALLPPPLREANPWDVPRRVDGVR